MRTYPHRMDAFDLKMSIAIKLGETEVGLGVSKLELNFDANSTDVREREIYRFFCFEFWDFFFFFFGVLVFGC